MDGRSLVAAFVGAGRNGREEFLMRKLCKVMASFTPLIIATIFHLYTYVVSLGVYVCMIYLYVVYVWCVH